MKLVIAEKPSVARDLANVLGANKKQNGYLEGNGYQVTWCIGHLVELAEPDTYNEAYRKWNLADLPILPEAFQYRVIASTQPQFQIVQRLIAHSEEIICATDAGRDGQLCAADVQSSGRVCHSPAVDQLHDRGSHSPGVCGTER